MRPYSLDFRKKIIEARIKENVSIRQLALRFRVSKNFVQKIIKRYEETGEIAPRIQGGGNEPKVNQESLVILIEIIEKNRGATLAKLCKLLEEKTKIKISIATMGRITQKLNYTVRKKSCMPRKKIVRKSRKEE